MSVLQYFEYINRVWAEFSTTAVFHTHFHNFSSFIIWCHWMGICSRNLWLNKVVLDYCAAVKKVSDNETTELRSDFLRRPTVKRTAACLTHRLSSSVRQYIRNLLQYRHSVQHNSYYVDLCIMMFTDISVDGDKQGWAIQPSSSLTVLEALKQDPFRLYGRVKGIWPIISTTAL